MSSADPAEEAEILARKVCRIIMGIEGFIQEQRMQEEQAELQRSEAFDALKTLYANQINDAIKEKMALEGFIEMMSSQITSASNEKFEAD
jgi:hypothetical protein